MTRALYAGSFDPVTHGHLDIIRRARRLFGEVVVGVGINADKRGLFEPEERAEMIRCELAGEAGVEVITFSGLAVDCARARGCGCFVRGIRGMADLDGEMTMAVTNRRLDEDIETVFLPADARFRHLSSRLVREVLANGRTLDDLVPPAVAEKTMTRLQQRKNA